MGDAVSLIQTGSSAKEIRDSIAEALDLIHFESKDSVESVAIKPNLCYYWSAATGQTTDPRVVAGIIDHLRERYGVRINIRVVEADATAMRTKYAFPMLGYEELAKNRTVELFNLSRDSLSEKTVEVDGREVTFEIPQSLLETDLFINVPKLKTARETKITCALKNIFGCIASPRKIAYHRFLSKAIVGINKVLHPNLTIVDGLVALGRSPMRLDLIMASSDPFSIDWIASQIMGYDPSAIEFLRLAMKEKVGDPEGITTCGENPDVFREIFPKESFFSSKSWWNVQLKLLRVYANVVGDVIPPFLEET